MSKGILRILCLQSSKYVRFIRFFSDNSSNKEGSDTLDEFTSQLMQKKSEKWVTAKKKILPVATIASNLNDINLSSDIHQNDLIFINALENNDIKTIKKLIGRSIAINVTPSFKICEKVVSFCSQNTLKDSIFVFIDYIGLNYPDEYSKNSNFKHYIAEFYWLSGNITKSLELFDHVYFTNQHLRKKVKFLLRCLIFNIVDQTSEAGLFSVIQFTEKIVEHFRDYYLLSYVWQNCFLSDWYADQCTANDLLERNERLAVAIGDRLPFILNYSVTEHKPEILYRLMEVLLKYELKEEYTIVLHTLFNYKYRCRDLRSCAEIVQWSININVPLSSIQHEQFLTLLLGHQLPKQTKKTEEKPTDPSYKLKF